MGEDPRRFFAAAGDTQTKPTRVSGGLDLLVLIITSLKIYVVFSIAISKLNSSNYIMTSVIWYTLSC